MTTPRQLHDLPSMRGSSPGLLVARPRRGGRRRLLALGLLLAVAGLGLRGAAGAEQEAPADGAFVPSADAEAVARAARQPADAAEATMTGARDATADATGPVAEVGGLRLRLPSDDILLVGYHEASKAGALGMAPVGQGLSNENTTRFTLPPDDPDGAPYHVLSSRGRVMPPTSAVDLVMRDDDPVRSPVTGTVLEVRPYALYGKHADSRIEIRPADAPHLRVVLIHVDGVQVAAGDEVTAGETVLADTANRFPFASHVDRYLDERWPHVHMEVVDPRQRTD